MTSWQAYVLTYKAQSPVLLGRHPLGFIQRTRFYAPGWTLWGAITARLTRACLNQATGQNYDAMGRFVADNLLASYAFVLVDGSPAWPGYDEQGRACYGVLTATEFERRLLTSFGQTAVSAATATAESRTLHETEALAAHCRSNGGDVERVLWQFTLYVREKWRDPPSQLDGLTAQEVLAALDSLSVGADRGYGLGRLERWQKPKLVPVAGEERPRPLEWDPSNPVLRAHVPLEEIPGEVVRGRAELVPWRWWQNAPGKEGWGPGQLRIPRLFYAPGSRVELKGWAPVVGPQGVWLTGRSDACPATS